MASSRETNSLCLKRKLVEDYLSEECKSRRIKSKNGPSSDSSAKLCNCNCIRPNLADDCDNFLKSGVPSRIMYYRQGSWHNFPEKMMKSLIEEFSGNKSSVVSVMDDEPLLIDFLSMTMVNLKSRKQRSVAWVDDTGKCFSPSLFFDEEIDDMAKGESANVQSTAQGIVLDKDTNAPPEVVKQVVLDSSSSVPHKLSNADILRKKITTVERGSKDFLFVQDLFLSGMGPFATPNNPHKLSNADILRKKITTVERGSKDFLFVQDLFLSGMGPFATPNNLLCVYCYSPNDITAQCRLEAFERQIRSTKEERGDANVRYGWLGSRKNDIVRILINGLGPTGEHVEKSDLSAGVYLSPADRTFTSVGLCDVDEKGVQYMLLCRVILGNVEAVEPGSHEFFPTSEIYDSGVDDCLNPKCYVMWPSHLSTHMRLEYLVSFKLAPEARNYLLGLKGLWFRPPSKEVAVDISALQHVMCEASEGPSTPWISFKVLFRLIQDKISVIARELLFHHDEELKERKITREEMVKKMMIIVGEKILMEALKELHYCPSLWYKSSGEAISSDPARTEAEQTTGRNCNHGDSCAQNATAEHSAGPVSTKVCGALPTDMAPKGSDYPAPSGVPKTSSSTGAKCLGSQGMETEVRDSPMQIMSLGNSAAQPARYQDPTVTRMAPIICDDPLRISPGISASPGVEVCNSVPPTTGPPGCASLAATNNASKTHEISAPGSTPSPKGRESVLPSLALGNSEIAGIKRLNSAPRMTPKGQEFLSLGIASQSPPLHPLKGPDASLPAARPPVYPPGRGKSPSGSTGVCDSLSLSIAQQGRVPPASRAEPKQQGSPAADSTPESRRPPQAMDAATKVHNAPTPMTRERKDQAVAQKNKLPGPGLDGCSSHVETLIALSTPREKGER